MCREKLNRIIRDQSGATAIEYGLPAGQISATAIRADLAGSFAGQCVQHRHRNTHGRGGRLNGID